MKRIRIGIIGTGMAFERLHYPAFEMLNDKYEIVALCDVDLPKAEKWKDILRLKDTDIYTDYRRMMERPDIDAFDVLVPIELNFEVLNDVVKAGKPVICEKPLGPTIEQAKAARDLSRRYNVPIMIAENYRYNEEMNMLKDLVENKKVGNIYYFIWNRVVNFPEEMPTAKFSAREWRQHPEFPGGVIMDTGVHDVAGLRHIFGKIDRLQAFGREQEEDFAPYSVLSTNMVFKSGIIGNFTFFCAGKEALKPLTGLRIFGQQGMIYLEHRDKGKIKVIFNDGKTEEISYKPQRGYYNELLNFYNAMTGKEQIRVTPEVEYGDAMTIFAILKSAKENQILPVDEEPVKILAYEPLYR